MGESSEVQSDVVCTVVWLTVAVVWLTAVVVCEVVVVTSLELLLVSEHPHIDISIAEMTAVTISFFIVSPLYL